ncbi:UNVERIFIED_ORG: hypothetical protein ABIC62_006291 [Burkholderia sp. 1595]|uniref:Uncharacterized protein n=1 Tax=Paraburkholderia terricola TaxID=169427 RepID=A0ABU1M213_9BURK|nr:hypothetical protein [Paraburkholderia terricola]MDR6484755.1 hypothetical protein [Paraburkholderia terricola]
MSQQVSDLLEWRTALGHPAGYRVPKNMRAAHSLLQPAAFGSVTYRVSYDVEVGPSVLPFAVKEPGVFGVMAPAKGA